MIYTILADLIVAIHFCFVAYVVVGQILIWTGLIYGWRWVLNPWFRISHLLAILIVGLEAIGGISCPLTDWEFELRELAGRPVEKGTFIGRWLHTAIFVDVSPAILNALHITFALIVLATFMIWPPRLRRRIK